MTLHPGNLAGKPPLGLKGAKQPKAKRTSGKDPTYLDLIRRLPCVICGAWGYVQTSQTQAHHTICGRYGQRKTPGRQAIPLCEGHHQGEFDTSKIAIHRDRALWVDTYGADTEYIALAQDMVERLERANDTASIKVGPVRDLRADPRPERARLLRED